MRAIISIILIFHFYSIVAQNEFENLTQKEACVILWMKTEKPWFSSYEKIVELVDYWKANVDFIDPYEKPKTTPFLNASGMLKRLDKQGHFTQAQIDSMEIEAVKIVKYLAEKGANIHAVSSNNHMNALHLAACGGREKVIPVLVKLGLDINKTDSEGGTPLIHAIGAGDLATVKAIVKCGADINICTPDGNSPLDWSMAYARAKEHLWGVYYHDQDSIYEFMQSLNAKHGKNEFTGYLNFKQ